MNTQVIKNHQTGHEFRMRLVNQGDAYGLGMQLTHENADPMVEFYDAAYDFDTSPEGEVLGQYVSRYNLSTLTGEDGWSPSIFDAGLGLNLEGGVPAWTIDAKGMADVKEALIEMGAIAPEPSTVTELGTPC
jgi:hypothetical protein